MFKRDTQFDAENYTITVPSSSTTGSKDVTISVFDTVVVDVEVEKDKNTQRGRVKMTLVSPVDSRPL
jgi:exosome complex exonuclease DIS3/RRP44